MIFLCFSVLLYTIDSQRKEAKAFPLAVAGAGLLVATLALGTGIAVTDKNTLQGMTEDFLGFVENMGAGASEVMSDIGAFLSTPEKEIKKFISTKVSGAFFDWIKSKGWGGEEAISSFAVATTTNTYFNQLCAQLNSDDVTVYDAAFVNEFITKANSGDYSVCSYKYAFDHWWFFLIPNNATDLYGYYTSVVDADGNVTSLSASSEFIRFSIYDGVLKSVSKSPISMRGVLDDLTKFTDGTLNFPAGIKMWSTEETYKTQNELFLLGITGTNYINANVDFIANPDYQTVDTAISIPSIDNSLTVDELLGLIDKAISDNMIGYAGVIEDLIGDDSTDDSVAGGAGEGENDNDEDNENNGVVGGDWIIPGLGIQWFESLLDEVKNIPEAIGEKVAEISRDIRFAYEDFKEWLALQIKSIPGYFETLFTTVTDAIADIPGALSGYFTDVVTAIEAIEIPTVNFSTVVEAITNIPNAFSSYFTDVISAIEAIDLSVNFPEIDFSSVISAIQAIPGALAGYFADVISAIKGVDLSIDFPTIDFSAVIEAIQAIPGQFTSLIDRIIEAIQALPGAISEYFDWAGVIEAINALADILSNIFVIDGVMIHTAYMDLADSVSTHWHIFDQLKQLCDVAVTESKIEYPVIYMGVPKILKSALSNSDNFLEGTESVYNKEKGVLVMDLANYKELFKWCRRVSGGFIWFLLFRWLMKKFDIQIVLSS